jgi:acyl transferase domain-containing protein
MAFQQHAEHSIAIIGMAGRFPGAPTLDDFWSNLREGRVSIRTFTDAELEAAGVAPEERNASNYVRAGTVLDGAEWFDAALFGYSPREAELLDPQHRLVLECALEALEDAGYDPNRSPARIGLMVGSASNSSFLAHLVRHPDILASAGEYSLLLGNERDFLATRVSYKLNLTGPSFTVQSACSTSLVAVHLGCQSLLCGESDIALVGGVCVRFPQIAGYTYDVNGVASPDGQCRPFDAAARGSVLGRGVGIVVMKRYLQAVVDGDHIRAVILGSAVNNDGHAKVGFTAPSVRGQADVISEAVALAGISADTISYVEAHGTATALGDPIEIAALAEAFKQSGGCASCAIGSVKANIGHLDAAAGVAGLIKTVLMLQHREIPPLVHFESANPHVPFDGTPFFVNTAVRAWPDTGGPRRAGVSSFGIGGTNAHLVLEQAPARRPGEGARPWQLLSVSAASETAREEAVQRVQHAVDHARGEVLADAAYTLHVGRRQFRHRWMQVVSATGERFGDAVRQHAGDETVHLAVWFGSDEWTARARGQRLYAGDPLFRSAMDECRSMLKRIGAERSEESQRFALLYSLGCLWRRWGVKEMAGEAAGAWVAASVTGTVPLDQAIRSALAEVEPAREARRADRLYVDIRPGEASAMCSLPLDESIDEQAHALSVLGRLWSRGAAVDWEGFYGGQRRNRVVLPTYPFQRRKHWLEPRPLPQRKLPRRPVDEWFYVPSWKRSVPARQLGASLTPSQRWVIFDEGDGVGRGVAEAAEGAGKHVVLVSRGERFERSSPHRFVIRAGVVADYDQLLADVAIAGTPDVIIHFWNVTGNRELSEAAYEDRAFFDPVYLVQALGRLPDCGRVSILLVADHLNRITGDEPLVPAKALLRGLCQVVPQEFPHIGCRSVDVHLPSHRSDHRARVIAQIADEAEYGRGPDAVAYRDAARFVETIEPVAVSDIQHAAPVLRERGVYLITGGLGGIGRALARYLAEAWHARLALTYCHARDEAAAWEIENFTSSITRAGGETLVIRADVADPSAMQLVRERIFLRFGRVNGVIHASGISPGGLIQGKTPDKARAVLRPKVAGLRVLEAIFPPAELDFLLLCSSLASLAHVIGQSDYTAANAYFDAYAQRTASPAVVSVNWDAWLHIGMASRARSAAPLGSDAEDDDGILPREGVEVFGRAIHAGLPQLAVSTKDLAAQIRISRQYDRSALLALAGGTSVAAPRPRRAEAGLDPQLPKNEIERRVARIWQDALGIVSIDVAEDFFDLGGNSLVGIQILARLREAFPVELPLSAIFETRTIAGMAASLATELARALERTAAGSSG